MHRDQALNEREVRIRNSQIRLSLLCVLTLSMFGAIGGLVLDSDMAHGAMIGGTLGVIAGIVTGGFLGMIRGKFHK
ncbi:MAG: hypothetical protein P1V97_23155 [Planctomycetota bacterium]|nr:hypothetical protein [Planctomycetota bacterium]